MARSPKKAATPAVTATQTIDTATPNVFDFEGTKVNMDSGAETTNFVRNAIKLYRLGNYALHSAVAVAVFHAQQHGDPTPLNLIWKEIHPEKEDRLLNSLRIWVGRAVTVTIREESTVTDDDGNEIVTPAVNFQWMQYSKESGFKVKSRRDEKGNIKPSWPKIDGEPLVIRDLRSFEFYHKENGTLFDRNNKEDPKAFGMAELLKMIARFGSQVASKAESKDLAVPASLHEPLKVLATRATQEAAILGIDIAGK